MHAGRAIHLLKGYLSNYCAGDVSLRVRKDSWPGSGDACQHLELFLSSETPKGPIGLEMCMTTPFSPVETACP